MIIAIKAILYWESWDTTLHMLHWTCRLCLTTWIWQPRRIEKFWWNLVWPMPTWQKWSGHWHTSWGVGRGGGKRTTQHLTKSMGETQGTPINRTSNTWKTPNNWIIFPFKTYEYCLSCGYKVQKYHSSATLWRENPWHQIKAMQENLIGWNQDNKYWKPKL